MEKICVFIIAESRYAVVKVDAAKAQSTVQAAFAGGVIIDNADNAYMRHDANYAQPDGGTLNSTEAANFYLAKPFVDSVEKHK